MRKSRRRAQPAVAAEVQELEDRSLMTVAIADSYSIAHNMPLMQLVSGVLENDTPDYDENAMPLPMTATLVSAPAYGTLTYLNSDGSFEYLPPATNDWPATWTASGGTTTFDYDNGGSIATVTITVTNAAPTTTTDPSPMTNYSVSHNQTLSVIIPGVLANHDDPDMDSLTAILVTDVANGSLTFREDGSFDYTPDPGFDDVDSFIYQASDGLALSDPITITIEVTNTPPQAYADPDYSVVHDRTLTVDVPGVLSNDMDMDGDPLTAILVQDVSSGKLEVPPGSTFKLKPDGSFKYTPNLNFVGIDTFTYKVNDGFDDSDTVTVTINVTNAAPVAVSDTNNEYETEFDTPLIVPANGVLANDTDMDDDSLTAVNAVTYVTAPPHSLNSNGSFIFTPPAGFYGVYSFLYQAYDGIVRSAVATTNITVKKPVVTITAPDPETSPAKEVGSVSADFTLSRTGGLISPLSVKLSLVGSTAADNDYDCDVIYTDPTTGMTITTPHPSVPNNVTIPANVASIILRIKPLMDTTIEGIESLKLTVVENTPNNYAVGDDDDATVKIRDRAGVKSIRATGGDITNVPRVVSSLELTQEDFGDFEAVPTDGGDFATGEPTWTVTGQGGSSGETRSVFFDRFYLSGVSVTAQTPANVTPKTVVVDLIPYPTARLANL